MIGVLSLSWPVGAALLQRLCGIMDIVLHLGAHRTGTTTFQTFLKDKAEGLDQAGIAVWRPAQTRKGMFDGLVPNPMNRAWRKNMQERAEGRVQIQLSQQIAQGHHTLLVSDENMMGSIIGNLRHGSLYPAAGERMARYLRAFGGQVDRVVLTIRSLDTFWASSMSHAVTRGRPVASQRKIDDLVKARRGWRDVIMDVACALPDTTLTVMPFESHLADPDTVLKAALLDNVPSDLGTTSQNWINRSPKVRELRKILIDREQDPDQLPDVEGVWQPFNPSQKTALQEAYSDDLFWLAQGADGLATLTENAIPASGHFGADVRGHIDDEKGRLESTG